MDKKSIYHSMGFASLLLLVLGALAFITNSGLVSGSNEYRASAEAALEAQEAVSSAEYCPTDAGSSTFLHLSRQNVAALGSTMRLSRIALNDFSEVESIIVFIGENEYEFAVADSYSGFVGMSPVIGDNIAFADGSLSFNLPEELGSYSIHFRYFDLNEAVVEINTTRDCLPFRSSVVMLPCEDCKVKTIVNNQFANLMLNQGHLAMSFSDFSGSTLDGLTRGVALSGLSITPEFQMFEGLSNLSIGAPGAPTPSSGEPTVETSQEASNTNTGGSGVSNSLNLDLMLAGSFNPRLAQRLFVVINER